MKNRCPCEECISLPMCINRIKVSCKPLCDYVGKERYNYIKNCHVLGIHKSLMFYKTEHSDSIEFVKDNDEAYTVIHNMYVHGRPILSRIKHHLIYLSLRGLVHILRVERYLKGRLKLVYKWDTNED